MQHTISVLVENEFGVLSRVASLFSGRGFNIDSLSVAPTNEEGMSRMTIVTRGDEQILEQITKQLNKLIDVVKLIDITAYEHIQRELMLVKVLSVENAARQEVMRLVDIFRSRIIDVSPTTFVIEVTGEKSKLDAFLGSLEPGSIIEVVRSGVTGVMRGERSLTL